MITIYGVAAVTFMMIMYTLEGRHRRFVLGFAFGCVLTAGYGFLAGAWPFGVVELIWAIVALRRWSTTAVTPVAPGTDAHPEDGAISG